VVDALGFERDDDLARGVESSGVEAVVGLAEDGAG
jgi:hypothetical protein